MIKFFPGGAGVKAWRAGPEWGERGRRVAPAAWSGASGRSGVRVSLWLRCFWPRGFLARVHLCDWAWLCHEAQTRTPVLHLAKDLLAPPVKMVPGWSMTTRRLSGQGRSRAESGMRT